MALRLHVTLLLFAVAIAVASSNAMVAKKRYQEGLDEFSRRRRMPYLYPGLAFQRTGLDYDEDFDDDADLAYYRRRRSPSSSNIFLIPSHKFKHWKYLVERRDDDDQDLERGMERRRRVPYYYPQARDDLFDSDEFELDAEKKMVRKRGIPYFYPNYHYQYVRQPEPLKRLFWKREEMKRSLGDTLENDDLTAFGYDKRADEDVFNDIDQLGADEDRRRKKKRMVAKKST